jgi:hypothetical protein
MLWHILVGCKANGIEFNVTYANFSSNVWKWKLFLVGWAQCLEIDQKWYLNIQPNEQKPKLLKTIIECKTILKLKLKLQP